MDKVKLMFDGVLKECTREEDRNGEYLFVADDGSFIKFPKDADLESVIEAHNDANSAEVEVIPDVTYGKVITRDADGNDIE